MGLGAVFKIINLINRRREGAIELCGVKRLNGVISVGGGQNINQGNVDLQRFEKILPKGQEISHKVVSRLLDQEPVCQQPSVVEVWVGA